MSERTLHPGDSVRVAAGPECSADASEYARVRIGNALEHAGEPILSVHVRLSRHRDPAVALPVVAHANVDLNGRVINAHASGATEHEAVDLLADRIRRQIDKAGRDWEAIRGSVANREIRDFARGHIDTEPAP
jgi:ribosome-associated translation inhibitor RaiA